MARWCDHEWYYCLYCFYNNDDVVDAVKRFKQKYPKRTRSCIEKKFKNEKLNIFEYLGYGLKKTQISKKCMVQELKNVYRLLGKPYTRKQFDGLSRIKSEILIGYFGSWNDALESSELLKKFNSYNNVLDTITSFDPEKEIKENWLKEKEKILAKAEQRKIDYLRQQSHKLDIVNEMINEAIAKADPVLVDIKIVKKPFIHKNKEKPTCTMWFEFSDLQLGTLIKSEEMGGLNQHNWVIWQEKLNIWKKQVIDKIDRYKRNYNVDRVVIACLGDMLEGQNIFKSQVWSIDSNVVDQAINGANDTAAAFIEIFMTHHDIHFDIFEVFGNHGRIGGKGELPYNCSMDKVYQRMLQGQLEKVKQLNNYTYYQNEVWFYFVQIYGWNHLLLHGDQGMSKLWSNRPTVNGLEKGLIRYNQMFQQQVHFIHCGHFHNDVAMSFNLSQILINGSFIGTSNFSASQLVASNPPVQILHIFEPRVGLYATERMILSNDIIRKSLEPKTLIEL